MKSFPSDNANKELVLDIAKDTGAVNTTDYAKIIAEQWDDTDYRSHVFALIYLPTSSHDNFCTYCAKH